MGVDVNAIAGYGVIFDTSDYDYEVGEILGDLWDPERKIIAERIGGDGDTHVFVGIGGKADWRKAINLEPIPIPDLDEVRQRIRTFLEGVELPKGDNAYSLYDEAKFGFYVNIHVY
ncbi:hypothetical protein GURKE_01660 [Brevundimonas phage vB_BpoS-Gurke]|uniref:Uncharacterized protein n=1 Tax=Brevundimonas phage vB_BpoS-Gurke TaxID=2948599 RepID=A0A9E7N456_9CAUD|nr:hypothetical protein GURKE_01660 [Brevundimonas phage vB_BpoS-Gurke]